jgi:branched-chain amino acid transport system substrate-binding protein
LQAVAIADEVDQSGASRTTLAYIDDEYGQAFADSVESSLTSKGIQAVKLVPFSANNASIEAAAKSVAATAVNVVVVLGDATAGRVMLEAIDGKEPGAKPHYIINDAMRRPAASAEPFGASLAPRVIGVSPLAYSADPQFLAEVGATPDDPGPYAANAYDCVNLIALGAMASASTQPAAIASQIPAVSASGSPCMDFAQCVTDMKAGSNINYDGPGGRLTVGSNGDLSEAVFEVFGFDGSGRDVKVNTVAASG